MIGPDDRTVTDTALSVRRGDEEFWVETEPDGSFNVEVPAGSFKLQVWVREGNLFHSVGWYDSTGGITSDPALAFEVIVRDTEIDDLRIMLPADAKGLISRFGRNRSPIIELCPAITHTSTTTPTPSYNPAPWPTYVAPTSTLWPPLPPIRQDAASRMAARDQWRDQCAREGIDRLSATKPEVAEKISALSWIGDGIDGPESLAVRGLTILAGAGLADNLIDEPWVVEGENLPALQSIWYLRKDVEKLTKIMTHPNFSDGISRQEAKILATLHPDSDPELLDKLLESELVALEERTIVLPLAGEIELTVIRTSARIDYAMDSLELAIRNIEEFMGLPLPIRHVIVWFDNELEHRGVNYATYFAVSVKELSESKQAAIALFAHEAGHYYWRDFPRWKSEGAAHILAGAATSMLQRRLISTNCGQTQSIAEFERFTSNSRETLDCHYSLGERLFRDLHRKLDDTIFRLGFRRLHLHTLSEFANECGDSDNEAICLVKEAFTAYSPEEKAPAIDEVIDRWYDVPMPHDLSWIEDTPVEPGIAAIGGRIEDAYLSIFRGGHPVSVVFVGPNRNPVVHLNLDYSYGDTKDLNYLPIDVEVYLEDGSEIKRFETELSVLPLPAGVTRHDHAIGIAFWRETGRYWVQLYWGEQKIAEATFEAVPEPDPLKIRGAFTDTEAQALEEIGIWLKNEEGRYWVESGPDGTFEVEVSPGSYIPEVFIKADNQWYFVGWYDGEGGMTTDPGLAFEVIAKEADVEGIDIKIPMDTESLICPSGSPRSQESGLCQVGIRGSVTGPEGQPLERIALWVKRSKETYSVVTRPNGTFDVVVPSGTFIVEVSVLVGSEYFFVGWYDSTGGITIDPNQRFAVTVGDTVVEGVDIMLPKDTDGLLCPSGSHRSTITGRCP